MSLGCCTHVEKGRRGPGYLEIVAVRRGGTKPTQCHPYEAPKPQGVLRVSSTSEHWLNDVEWISVENGYGPLCLSHGFQPIFVWAKILWKTHTGPFSYISLRVGLLTHRLGWRSTVLHALGLPRPTALGSPQWMIRMFTWNL